MKETLEQYIFELTERVTRFYIHLDEIKEQFYVNEDSRIKDKISFINSYEECLEKALRILIDYSAFIEQNTSDENLLNTLFSNLVDIAKNINDLHFVWLKHLPRPSEPIELRRFCRIIEEQAIKLNAISKSNSYSQISIFVSEEIGETLYKHDPLLKFKIEEFNKCLESFNNLSEQLNTNKLELFKEETEPSTIHITIPRIDANNPCHWPTLMHEVAHKVPRGDFFESGNILDDFLNSLNESQKEDIKSLRETISLEDWLKECWCDLFACVSMGHSVWFSQYASFLASAIEPSANRTHPPAQFRVNLIEKILTHRFRGSESFEEVGVSMSICENILKKLDDNNHHKYSDRKVRLLFLYFRQYFLGHFFKIKNDKIEIGKPQLNARLKGIVKYVTQINPTTIKRLVSALDMGIPIPSIRVLNSPYRERPTTVQEILFAAWVHRNSSLKSKVLLKLKEIKKEFPGNESIRKKYKETIEKDFRRFDQSILRSIQVSEWVYLLQEKPDEAKEIQQSKTTKYKNILSDSEIKKLICSDEIKIIPIINFQKQLGSTSFDIRLGTSFQLYFPTQYGIIDFTENETLSQNNSRKVNLDFLEPITITPNQFILGHSMEYIKLPDTISGDLEGRSSFARLGIEIHMTAGFVDPGFEGVLTFEIFNAGPNPVKLYPGMRLGQLRFSPVNAPGKSYAKQHAAKYRGLLEHHNSLQSMDYEVKKIKEALLKTKKPAK